MQDFYDYVLEKIKELESSKTKTDFGNSSLETLRKTIRDYNKIIKQK